MELMREEKLQRLNSVNIGLDHPNYLHYKYYHRDLFRALEKYTSGEVLDIGCGNKPYKNNLSSTVTKYIGCDIVQSSEHNVDILCKANEIPLNNSSFDAVISTQTIEHIEDHQGLVNEAYRLLKPSGYFIVSGPLYWPLHEEPYDFFRFTKYGFRYILEKAGFEIMEENSNGGKWALAGQALIQAIYPELYSQKGFKAKVIRRLFNTCGGIVRLNKIFENLDIKYHNEINTMNYVFVAKKMTDSK